MRKVLFAAACALVALLLIALIFYALFAMQSQPPSMAIQRALDTERVKDIAFYGAAERGMFIAFPATAAARSFERGELILTAPAAAAQHCAAHEDLLKTAFAGLTGQCVEKITYNVR